VLTVGISELWYNVSRKEVKPNEILRNFRASGIDPNLVREAGEILQEQVEGMGLNEALGEGWIHRSCTTEGYCDCPGNWHGLSGNSDDERFEAFGRIELRFDIEE